MKCNAHGFSSPGLFKNVVARPLISVLFLHRNKSHYFHLVTPQHQNWWFLLKHLRFCHEAFWPHLSPVGPDCDTLHSQSICPALLQMCSWQHVVCIFFVFVFYLVSLQIFWWMIKWLTQLPVATCSNSCHNALGSLIKKNEHVGAVAFDSSLLLDELSITILQHLLR